MNKRVLYEQIMSDVSKVVKKHLNENDFSNSTKQIDWYSDDEISNFKQNAQNMRLRDLNPDKIENLFPEEICICIYLNNIATGKTEYIAIRGLNNTETFNICALILHNINKNVYRPIYKSGSLSIKNKIDGPEYVTNEIKKDLHYKYVYRLSIQDRYIFDKYSNILETKLNKKSNESLPTKIMNIINNMLKRTVIKTGIAIVE